ncbi:MAG TPA: hypothetical protein DDZ88_19370 [Verrucomicrobiales bacterium]|nr:hypothetical protein [Verrucomicrobiales bacterium]
MTSRFLVHEPALSPDGKTVAFGWQGDIWTAPTSGGRATRLTTHAALDSGAAFSSDGKQIAFNSEREGFKMLYTMPAGGGEPKQLTFHTDGCIADADGKNAKRVLESWNPVSVTFSPDGTWIAYSQADEWFNDDIWLMPLDGSKPPYNLSRHPDNDSRPVWSPDGKMIAWTGQREIREVDVFYVNLRAEDDEKTKRERTLVKAREKIAKSAKPAAAPKKEEPPKAEPKKDDKPADTVAKAEEKKPEEPKKEAPKPKPLQIDLEGIHERVHRLKIADSTEHSLVWSPDSKRLAFQSQSVEKKLTRTVEFPDELTPKQLGTVALTNAAWLKADDQIVGLLDGKPASINVKTGAPKTMSFRAQQAYSRAEKLRAVFDQCWQVMRDRFYDDKLGNRDWSAVRAKYRDMAAESPDMKGAVECVWLILGELNGSHLGFTMGASNTMSGWREETAHLGLRFDATFAGPGWKVRDVIPKSPASRKESRVEAGEVVLKVDGKDVTSAMDASSVLNGPMERDVVLIVQNGDKTREIILRPINYTMARRLLYDAWIENNRTEVEKASGGTLGYLHISAMDDASFQKFQEELYHAGAGKDGLIIDVRENGGGSTTDHLLTALTQPRHAIAIPRGSQTSGYPQDRIIYATWQKPIVVLCNQNSYSNAEVFSHAIKTLKRGQLVGVQTAGGAISTGATSIMDVDTLRLPFRGWYVLSNGQDRELMGAKPDHIVWPQPGDKIDRQLDKAVEMLKQDVTSWKKRPQPKLIRATERQP